ncbi:MAG: GNAT family N-acetyltransferase [Saprospiraceae bacterium]
MMAMLDIRFDREEETVRKILELQRKNLRKNLSQAEAASQGFVFVEHDFGTLSKICSEEAPVVAYDGQDLVGYAICMNKIFSQEVPELKLFFEQLDHLVVNGQSLGEQTYIACGQICIAKAYRGQNLMSRLYRHMQTLNDRYMYCVTEISTQNIRSLYAHQKVGFRPIMQHEGDDAEIWEIVLWEWNS